MPLIEADFNQDYEDKPVPEGRYDLRVVKAKDGQSKAGADQVVAIIEVEGEAGSSAIFHYLTMPVTKKQAKDRNLNEDDQRTTRLKMQGITRFLHLFGVPFEKDGFNSEDLIGATAKGVELTQEVPEGFDTPVNRIKLPPVPHK